jgi:hypothetical protein
MFQENAMKTPSVPREDRVYEVDVNHNGGKFRLHVAVKRDDLRAFIVAADIPLGGGASVGMLRVDLINKLFGLPLVDWENEQYVFAETTWLKHRHIIGLREVRRVNISDEGDVSLGPALPGCVAEPLLRMLEGSVPAPDLDEDILEEGL